MLQVEPFDYRCPAVTLTDICKNKQLLCCRVHGDLVVQLGHELTGRLQEALRIVKGISASISTEKRDGPVDRSSSTDSRDSSVHFSQKLKDRLRSGSERERRQPFPVCALGPTRVQDCDQPVMPPPTQHNVPITDSSSTSVTTLRPTSASLPSTITLEHFDISLQLSDYGSQFVCHNQPSPRFNENRSADSPADQDPCIISDDEASKILRRFQNYCEKQGKKFPKTEACLLRRLTGAEVKAGRVSPIRYSKERNPQLSTKQRYERLVKDRVRRSFDRLGRLVQPNLPNRFSFPFALGNCKEVRDTLPATISRSASKASEPIVCQRISANVRLAGGSQKKTPLIPDGGSNVLASSRLEDTASEKVDNKDSESVFPTCCKAAAPRRCKSDSSFLVLGGFGHSVPPEEKREKLLDLQEQAFEAQFAFHHSVPPLELGEDELIPLAEPPTKLTSWNSREELAQYFKDSDEDNDDDKMDVKLKSAVKKVKAVKISGLKTKKLSSPLPKRKEKKTTTPKPCTDCQPEIKQCECTRSCRYRHNSLETEYEHRTSTKPKRDLSLSPSCIPEGKWVCFPDCEPWACVNRPTVGDDVGDCVCDVCAYLKMKAKREGKETPVRIPHKPLCQSPPCQWSCLENRAVRQSCGGGGPCPRQVCVSPSTTASCVCSRCCSPRCVSPCRSPCQPQSPVPCRSTPSHTSPFSGILCPASKCPEHHPCSLAIRCEPSFYKTPPPRMPNVLCEPRPPSTCCCCPSPRIVEKPLTPNYCSDLQEFTCGGKQYVCSTVEVGDVEDEGGSRRVRFCKPTYLLTPGCLPERLDDAHVDPDAVGDGTCNCGKERDCLCGWMGSYWNDDGCCRLKPCRSNTNCRRSNYIRSATPCCPEAAFDYLCCRGDSCDEDDDSLLLTGDEDEDDDSDTCSCYEYCSNCRPSVRECAGSEKTPSRGTGESEPESPHHFRPIAAENCRWRQPTVQESGEIQPIDGQMVASEPKEADGQSPNVPKEAGTPVDNGDKCQDRNEGTSQKDTEDAERLAAGRSEVSNQECPSEEVKRSCNTCFAGKCGPSESPSRGSSVCSVCHKRHCPHGPRRQCVTLSCVRNEKGNRWVYDSDEMIGPEMPMDEWIEMLQEFHDVLRAGKVEQERKKLQLPCSCIHPPACSLANENEEDLGPESTRVWCYRKRQKQRQMMCVKCECCGGNRCVPRPRKSSEESTEETASTTDSILESVDEDPLKSAGPSTCPGPPPVHRSRSRSRHHRNHRHSNGSCQAGADHHHCRGSKSREVAGGYRIREEDRLEPCDISSKSSKAAPTSCPYPNPLPTSNESCCLKCRRPSSNRFDIKPPKELVMPHLLPVESKSCCKCGRRMKRKSGGHSSCRTAPNSRIPPCLYNIVGGNCSCEGSCHSRYKSCNRCGTISACSPSPGRCHSSNESYCHNGYQHSSSQYYPPTHCRSCCQCCENPCDQSCQPQGDCYQLESDESYQPSYEAVSEDHSQTTYELPCEETPCQEPCCQKPCQPSSSSSDPSCQQSCTCCYCKSCCRDPEPSYCKSCGCRLDEEEVQCPPPHPCASTKKRPPCAKRPPLLQSDRTERHCCREAMGVQSCSSNETVNTMIFPPIDPCSPNALPGESQADALTCQLVKNISEKVNNVRTSTLGVSDNKVKYKRTSVKYTTVKTQDKTVTLANEECTHYQKERKYDCNNSTPRSTPTSIKSTQCCQCPLPPNSSEHFLQFEKSCCKEQPICYGAAPIRETHACDHSEYKRRSQWKRAEEGNDNGRGEEHFAHSRRSHATAPTPCGLYESRDCSDRELRRRIGTPVGVPEMKEAGHECCGWPVQTSCKEEPDSLEWDPSLAQEEIFTSHCRHDTRIPTAEAGHMQSHSEQSELKRTSNGEPIVGGSWTPSPKQRPLRKPRDKPFRSTSNSDEEPIDMSVKSEYSSPRKQTSGETTPFYSEDLMGTEVSTSPSVKYPLIRQVDTPEFESLSSLPSKGRSKESPATTVTSPGTLDLSSKSSRKDTPLALPPAPTMQRILDLSMKSKSPAPPSSSVTREVSETSELFSPPSIEGLIDRIKKSSTTSSSSPSPDSYSPPDRSATLLSQSLPEEETPFGSSPPLIPKCPKLRNNLSDSPRRKSYPPSISGNKRCQSPGKFAKATSVSPLVKTCPEGAKKVNTLPLNKC